jgi:DnaJ-class molecular chaperone
VFSQLSTCCICGGRGTNRVREPYVQCAFCGGSGAYPLSRLTCTACSGVGVHSVADQTMACPNCLGDGVEPTSGTGFYCLTCHGAGVVEGVG